MRVITKNIGAAYFELSKLRDLHMSLKSETLRPHAKIAIISEYWDRYDRLVLLIELWKKVEINRVVKLLWIFKFKVETETESIESLRVFL